MFGIKIGVFEVNEAIAVMRNCSGTENYGGWLCHVTKIKMVAEKDKFWSLCGVLCHVWYQNKGF